MCDSDIYLLERLFETGEIDIFLWFAHFQDDDFDSVPSCSDCVDFIAGVCDGGRDVIECFIEKTRKGVE